MDNGYSAIKEDEELIPLDQYRELGTNDWKEIVHNFFQAEGYEYRRPIAHYATPTEKVVEHALDATANVPDEWNSGDAAMVSGLVFNNCLYKDLRQVEVLRINGSKCAVMDVGTLELMWINTCRLNAIETQSQIEERERKEFQNALRSVWCDKRDATEEPITRRHLSRWTYDWLKSTDQLKDKSDEY